MDRKILFALLLLPGLAQAVICKTVGPDGVISFTNLPGNECPSGEPVEAYVPPAATAERAERLATGVTGSQVEFAGYASVRIESPEDGATIRSNEGRVQVVVALQPGLQQFHFITAYLDGKAHQGSYGSSNVGLTNVDRGRHRLYVTVKDSKGKTLTRSDEISFTVKRVSQLLGAPTTVNRVTGDDFIDANDPDTVPITGIVRGLPTALVTPTGPAPQTPIAQVYLEFSGGTTQPVNVQSELTTREYTITTPDGRRVVVTETFNWLIEVPKAWLVEEPKLSFQAAVVMPNRKLGKTTKPYAVDPRLRRADADFTPPPAADYSPPPPVDYRPKGDGISKTPGRNNPAFTPRYTP